MMLVRRPGNRLDRRRVFGEPIQWRLVQLIPHYKLVVIASGSQLTIFGIPFEATNFLLVAGQASKPLVGRTNVTVEY